MTMESNQKDFINTLSTIGNIVVPLVSVLQQKGFSIDDAARIAVAFAPVLASKRDAGAQPDGKGWSDDVRNVAGAVATIASLFQKAQPNGKGWSDDALNVAGTVATIASLFQKAQPNGKGWSDDARNVAIAGATIASLFQKAQPNGKDWLDVVRNNMPDVSPMVPDLLQKAQPNGKGWFGDALHVAQAAAVIGGMLQSGGNAKGWGGIQLPESVVPIEPMFQATNKGFLNDLANAAQVIQILGPVLAAQNGKGFSDFGTPYVNGRWLPGDPPPYVS